LAKQVKDATAETTVVVEYKYKGETKGTWRYDAIVKEGERVPASSAYLPKSSYKVKPCETMRGVFTFTRTLEG
jgi:hypothetical protein